MTPHEKIIAKIEDDEKTSYGKKEVLHFTRGLLSVVDKDCVAVDSVRRGDVFWGHGVGGKQRPWIALSCRCGIVVAVAVSSGDKAPRMVKSQCRLWPSDWIGSTVSIFDESYAKERVTRPYTNLKHLREIERSLAGLMGLRT